MKHLSNFPYLRTSGLEAKKVLSAIEYRCKWNRFAFTPQLEEFKLELNCSNLKKYYVYYKCVFFDKYLKKNGLMGKL